MKLLRIPLALAFAMLSASAARAASAVDCDAIVQAVAGYQSQGALLDYPAEVYDKFGKEGKALFALKQKVTRPPAKPGASLDELRARLWSIANESCATPLRERVELLVRQYARCRADCAGPTAQAGVPIDAVKALPAVPAEAPTNQDKMSGGGR